VSGAPLAGGPLADGPLADATQAQHTPVEPHGITAVQFPDRRFRKPLRACLPTPDLDDWQGVWTVAEQRGGELVKISLEMLTPAREIADRFHTDVTVVIMGERITHLAETLIAHGADRVLCVEHPALEHYRTLSYATVLTDQIIERKPEILLIGASHTGRDLSSRIAVSVQAGVTADCTELEPDVERRLLLSRRPAFGGRMLATIVCDRNCPQVATARLGIFPVPAPDESRRGETETLVPELDEARIGSRVLEFEETGEVDIQAADIIVAGGKGAGDAEGFATVGALAEALGGVAAASREAVDRGWTDRSIQVGQTGKSVEPKLFIAAGISGAVQHVAGMKTAKVIVAINSDANAQIFEYADYGIVGDMHAVFPMLQRLMEAGALEEIRREVAAETDREGSSETD